MSEITDDTAAHAADIAAAASAPAGAGAAAPAAADAGSTQAARSEREPVRKAVALLRSHPLGAVALMGAAAALIEIELAVGVLAGLGATALLTRKTGPETRQEVLAKGQEVLAKGQEVLAKGQGVLAKGKWAIGRARALTVRTKAQAAVAATPTAAPTNEASTPSA